MPSPVEEVERVFRLPALNFDPGQRYVHLIDQSCDVLGIEKTAYQRLPPDEKEHLVLRSYKKLATFTHQETEYMTASQPLFLLKIDKIYLANR